MGKQSFTGRGSSGRFLWKYTGDKKELFGGGSLRGISLEKI